jgi:hypothetical protein
MPWYVAAANSCICTVDSCDCYDNVSLVNCSAARIKLRLMLHHEIMSLDDALLLLAL